jgi:hypothetical protein
MSTTDARISRRRFLLGAAAGSTVAAGAIASRSKTGPAVPAKDVQATAAQTGYRETEHIRNYYRTTRV